MMLPPSCRRVKKSHAPSADNAGANSPSGVSIGGPRLRGWRQPSAPRKVTQRSVSRWPPGQSEAKSTNDPSAAIKALLVVLPSLMTPGNACGVSPGRPVKIAGLGLPVVFGPRPNTISPAALRVANTSSSSVLTPSSGWGAPKPSPPRSAIQMSKLPFAGSVSKTRCRPSGVMNRSMSRGPVENGTRAGGLQPLRSNRDTIMVIILRSAETVSK
jgi:hypothetical protein